ncbi:serine/threonine-protein kinase rio2 [Culex quinquefasciatus]|uniref:non-specific serine/threonine protein kinase n=1 Tax=Culex quinquefasciatus TaxID=7176 RepID=B0X304_CULQU|nr:serine/threonine-protein kinase rio2 [Culex quinquefasciatus]|eukprot:XP_001864026.1 serine/threonine-protein kinase rio2 [Culex quinquefasciatus]
MTNLSSQCPDANNDRAIELELSQPCELFGVSEILPSPIRIPYNFGKPPQIVAPEVAQFGLKLCRLWQLLPRSTASTRRIINIVSQKPTCPRQFFGELAGVRFDPADLGAFRPSGGQSRLRTTGGCNIYTVGDEEGDPLYLKLHRLGRVCFRNVKDKRDYHGKRHKMSWLYLSRISATREYAYMKALYDRGFPVPRLVDFNRHCLVDGYPLTNFAEVGNVEQLYDDLINLIVRLGNCGVIYGDFNEFNEMITEEDQRPILIYFPQMVSTSHPNAEMYFDRIGTCRAFGICSGRNLSMKLKNIPSLAIWNVRMSWAGRFSALGTDLRRRWRRICTRSITRREVPRKEETYLRTENENPKVEQPKQSRETSNQIGYTLTGECLNLAVGQRDCATDFFAEQICCALRFGGIKTILSYSGNTVRRECHHQFDTTLTVRSATELPR